MMPTMPGEQTAVANVKLKEYAVITIGLIAPDEADKLSVDVKARREKEAQEKAAAAATAVNPAEPAAPPRTAPPPARKQ